MKVIINHQEVYPEPSTTRAAVKHGIHSQETGVLNTSHAYITNDHAFAFSQGLNIITGASGTGKSTTARAVAGCIKGAKYYRVSEPGAIVTGLDLTWLFQLMTEEDIVVIDSIGELEFYATSDPAKGGIPKDLKTVLNIVNNFALMHDCIVIAVWNPVSESRLDDLFTVLSGAAVSTYKVAKDTVIGSDRKIIKDSIDYRGDVRYIAGQVKHTEIPSPFEKFDQYNTDYTPQPVAVSIVTSERSMEPLIDSEPSTETLDPSSFSL